MTRVAIGHPARKCLLWDRCSALCVFIIFLALLTMLFVIRYRNSSIEGIWKTASIDQKLEMILRNGSQAYIKVPLLMTVC